jgi:DNA-binding transcriptional ArsR family regulator
MDEQTELLREIRDLLLLIAEPAIAKRDETNRAVLRELAGRSKSYAKAVLLMDGTRTRKAIALKSGVDQGNLSRLVKSLFDKGLVLANEQPKVLISIPANFFEATEK